MNALALAGLVFAPFDHALESLGKSPVWTGFHENDPVLIVGRAERLELPEGAERWSGAELRRRLDGLAYGQDFKDWRAWEPWEEDESEAIRDCDDNPCDIKVDEAEAKAMDAAPEEGRLAAFLGLVSSRASRYLKDGTRSPYEFEGGIVDPWGPLSGGAGPAAGLPARARLRARRLDLGQDGMRPIRQLLDWRSSGAAVKGFAGAQAQAWVRDAYTNHYFDGWGERIVVSRRKGSREALVAHALLVEFDLLKKGDIVSRIARPKMRSAVKKLGDDYLEAFSRELRGAVGLPPADAPVIGPAPVRPSTSPRVPSR